MTLHFPNMQGQLTRADNRILDYISGNVEVFLFSSIGELARQTGVSEATISRFVRHMGCADFKELKRLVMEQTSGEGPAAKLAQTLGDKDGFTAGSFIRLQQLYLEKTLEGLSEEEFQAAGEAVLGAHRVFIHAKSASASLGRLLLFRLQRLGIEALLLPSGGSELLEGLAQVREDDLVLMFSLSKVSREGRIILDYSRQVGYGTAAFVSRSFIPEDERADIHLYAYRGEEKEYHSMTGPAVLVDALVLYISHQMGAQAIQNLSALHKLKNKYTL